MTLHDPPQTAALTLGTTTLSQMASATGSSNSTSKIPFLLPHAHAHAAASASVEQLMHVQISVGCRTGKGLGGIIPLHAVEEMADDRLAVKVHLQMHLELDPGPMHNLLADPTLSLCTNSP